MEVVYDIIEGVASKLGLPRSIIEESRGIATRMVEARIASRMKPEVVALASIIVACRLNGVGLGFKQITPLIPVDAKTAKRNAKKAFELARKYMEIYKPQVGVASYEDYVRIASKILGVPESSSRIAEELARMFKEKYGRRIKPMAVAGAAIYIALRKSGGPRMTMSSICSKLNITEPTLRNAIRMMLAIK